MTPTSQDVLEFLFDYVETQASSGTLQYLQRAVLQKGHRLLEREGQWPILDFPLNVGRILGVGSEEARAVAATCALFHGFADVTDDAQDHDLAPDPWATWGWEQAVNTGTSLLFQSLALLFDYLPSRLAGDITAVFVRAGLEMTYGQHVDLRGAIHADTRLGDYQLMVERKSGASFGAYGEAMALASGANPQVAQEIRAFARSLGVMFQSISDLHELWRPTLSSDFVNRRASFPIVLGFEQLTGAPRERFLALLRGEANLDSQRDLTTLLEKAGVRAYATLRIEVYRRQARAVAERLKIDADSYFSSLVAFPAFPEKPVAL